MHPRYKLAYFVKKKWPQEWLDAAKTLITEHWEKWYKPDSTSHPSTSQSLSDNIFASLDEDDEVVSGDALEDYLNTPPLAHVSTKDPIMWWTNNGTSPKDPLARMAIDLLSAPGELFYYVGSINTSTHNPLLPVASSTDIERGFSRSGLMVSPHRHCLSQESVRSGTVLSSWIKIPGLVPQQNIVQHFNDKAKRGKNKSATVESSSQDADIELL